MSYYSCIIYTIVGVYMQCSIVLIRTLVRTYDVIVHIYDVHFHLNYDLWMNKRSLDWPTAVPTNQVELWEAHLAGRIGLPMYGAPKMTFSILFSRTLFRLYELIIRNYEKILWKKYRKCHLRGSVHMKPGALILIRHLKWPWCKYHSQIPPCNLTFIDQLWIDWYRY